jgi:hypothetical protein
VVWLHISGKQNDGPEFGFAGDPSSEVLLTRHLRHLKVQLQWCLVTGGSWPQASVVGCTPEHGGEGLLLVLVERPEKMITDGGGVHLNGFADLTGAARGESNVAKSTGASVDAGD